jgi:hypothetical protein
VDGTYWWSGPGIRDAYGEDDELRKKDGNGGTDDNAGVTLT